MKTNAQWR